MNTTIVVVAIDDPESPRTWSGTPKSIIEASRATGREVVSLRADVPKFYDKALYTAVGLPLLGRGARGFRQYYGPRKKRLERHVSQHRKANSEYAYLHTDHMWTPFLGMGSRDFFFRDASWMSYSENQGVSARLRNHIGASVKKSLERAGHIFATSEWARKGLIVEGAHADAVTVVGTGVGNLIQPNFDRMNYATKRTLCIAKVRFENKGLDLLLDGFKIAHNVDSQLTLDLVVPAGIVPPQAGVNVHSDLSGQQLIELYKSVSLYAMPARYEPWGLVYLEAQLCALPVLGSSNCAFPELSNAGANGFVVDDLAPESIATALLEAHASPDVLEAKGRAGLQFAQNFTWGRTVDKMLSIIDSSI